MTCLLQGEHPEIFARIGVGCWKSGFRRTKALKSLKRGKIGPRLLMRSNRKSYTRFRLVPKSMTLDDLEGSLCTLFQNTCVFRSSLWKFEWRQIYTVSHKDVAQWLQFLPTFMPIFEGVHWREGVKLQWGNRKHGFSRLSTLSLRQLWKSGQSYYTVIFSLLFCRLSTDHKVLDL